MSQTESQMSHNDIEIIKKKVQKSKVFIFVLLSFLLLWGWGMCDTDTVFTLFNGIVALLFLVFFIFLVVLLKKIKTTKNDILSKIKIINEFPVLEKFCTGSSGSRDHIIVLDSKDIPKYTVTKKVYEDINIGDIVTIEYSKAAFWILKIEHNGISIENKNVIG